MKFTRDILDPLLRQRGGPLTRDLVLTPGKFGLGKVPARLQPDATTPSVCGFCATGCSLNIHLKDGVAINLSGDTEYPVNQGMACPKGWEALTPLDAPDRATTPLLRDAIGAFVPCDWERAMTVFTGKIKEIQAKYGPESVAWLGTGQMPTEELALLGALAKFGMGIVHGDGNTRQCMATAAMAYKECFGFDAPPYTYADFEESDVLVFVGANPCITHPIMWQRVMNNPHQPEIIVVDPRRTETAEAATRHIALRPKSDLALFYCVANILIAQGALDKQFIENHTTGFTEYARHVEDFTPDRVALESGLDVSIIQALADSIACGKRVSFWWTMGVNQSHQATRTAQAIIALALLTGNIGRPGTGANSITGQCNAMGSRIFSNTTNLFCGRDFRNSAHRNEVADILGIPTSAIPTDNSLAYDQILEGVRQGKIKALWVIATNPAHSWIQQDRIKELRENLDFLVVQDMYHSTETARLADLVLPAAGWGEKDGTFINSERRIGLIKKVRRAPGQALADFHIFQLIAAHWGCSNLIHRWSSPEAAFQILKELSRGRPCDISGIRDYRMLDEMGGVQWPFNTTDAALRAASGRDYDNQRRLFEDGKFFTDHGKAKFVADAPTALAEPVCADYPLVLITGRGSSAQWHTGSRTNKSAVLRKLFPATLYLEIHPEDAALQGITPNSLVRVLSRRGEILARATVTPTVGHGNVFLPMHYAETNRLTLETVDPISRQPAYKACAVRVVRHA